MHCSACHRTFSAGTLFDRHRTSVGDRGGCLDPATFTETDGAPSLIFRDGVWRYPPMAEAAIAAIRGTR